MSDAVTRGRQMAEPIHDYWPVVRRASHVFLGERPTGRTTASVTGWSERLTILSDCVQQLVDQTVRRGQCVCTENALKRKRETLVGLRAHRHCYQCCECCECRDAQPMVASMSVTPREPHLTFAAFFPLFSSESCVADIDVWLDIDARHRNRL